MASEMPPNWEEHPPNWEDEWEFQGVDSDVYEELVTADEEDEDDDGSEEWSEGSEIGAASQADEGDSSAEIDPGGEGGECVDAEESGVDAGVSFDPSSPNCPVCLDSWNPDGPHRVCCIPCGHVYGRSCLEKWLERCGKNSVKCPMCNRKFKQKEIINIYAPVIASQNDVLKKEVRLLREKNEELKSEPVNVERICEELRQVIAESEARLMREQDESEARLRQETDELRQQMAKQKRQITEQAESVAKLQARIEAIEERMREQVNTGDFPSHTVQPATQSSVKLRRTMPAGDVSDAPEKQYQGHD